MLSKDSRKSTSGHLFTLWGGAVSWRSIKQKCIADSTTEAEYVAVYEATKEGVWLKKFFMEQGVVLALLSPITLYCDNSGGSGTVQGAKKPREGKARRAEVSSH